MNSNIGTFSEIPISLESWMLLTGLAGGVLSCALSGLFLASVAARASPVSALRDE